MLNLKIGDKNEEGSVIIIAEDSLCYQVLSSYHGAKGVRTISKKLLQEYVVYLDSNSNATSQQAREDLCGKSDIDKFEYGYTATLLALAKLNYDVVSPYYIQFKHLLEYFCTHLQFIVTDDSTVEGYDEYLKEFVDNGSFKKSGQGWCGANIQKQIAKWENYTCGKVCINVYGSAFKSYATYLHWERTCHNIVANWEDDKIVSLELVEYVEKPKSKWVSTNIKFTLDELGLYDGTEPNKNVRHFYESFVNLLVGDDSYSETRTNKLLPIINLPLQQIYYGAPGTGKSFGIDNATKGHAVIRTTFHPDSDYSTFVGAYKPTMTKVRKTVIIGQEEKEVNPYIGNDSENKIQYSFVKQAFLKAYLGAWKKYAEAGETGVKPQFLVIEEINRGNCAQIFGDIFQLLDRQDNGFSSYPVEAETDLQQAIADAFNEEEGEYQLPEDGINVEGKVKDYTSNYGNTLSEDIMEGHVMLLPPNLYIWATMNTSDQSLFPIDSAFKRRWDWKYVPITDAKKDYKIMAGGKFYDWWDFLQKVNEAINEVTSSEDKKLGYFFCKADSKAKEDDKENTIISADRFVSKVLFYLFGDVLKDFDADDVTFTFDGTQYALLKWKDGDNQGQFRFSDFFDEKGDSKDDMVVKFLENIKVNG